VIAEACRRHDRKLVHVGTVNTLAIGSRESPADEETPLDNAGGQVPCTYVETKRAGVAEVLKRVDQGLRASIVHPGFMLGPWDWKPSSGRMMLEIGRGWKPICPTGGCSVCDPRDVAAGTIAAIEHGGDAGRQYILAGENWTYQKLWTEMARRMGTRPPLMKAGPLQLRLAGFFGDLWANVTGNEGDVNSAGVKMSSMFHWHDSSRATRELSYQFRDAHESLDASSAWIKEHHMR
jgi:dihydroflavonol-4-reductase